MLWYVFMCMCCAIVEVYCGVCVVRGEFRWGGFWVVFVGVWILFCSGGKVIEGFNWERYYLFFVYFGKVILVFIGTRRVRDRWWYFKYRVVVMR